MSRVERRFFKETNIHYSSIEDDIDKIKESYPNNKCSGVKMSIVYQYPTTSTKSNDTFNPQYCPFETCRKIVLEVNSKDIIQNSVYNFEICDDRDYAYVITGVKCILIFDQLLQELLDGTTFSPWFNGIVSAAKKICEHQEMILVSIGHLVEKWPKACLPVARECLAEYVKYLRTSRKLVNQCIKFDMTGDTNILKGICEAVPHIHKSAENCLYNFVNNGFDWVKLNKQYI